jgi:transcriptional regulator with XRE-family HTH domain
MIYKSVGFDTVTTMGQQDFKNLDDRFAAAFKVARDHAELSQEAIAERMRELGFDMSQPVIGKIERGQRKVSIGEAEALSSTVSQDLHSLLAGPQYMRLRRATAELDRLRTEVMQSIARFQSGQQAMALFADQLKGLGELGELDAEDVEYLMLEPIAEIVAELKKDNISANVARRHRDQLDQDVEAEHLVQSESRVREDSYFNRYLSAFGDEVNLSVDGQAFGAIFGLDIEEDANVTTENDG